MNVDLNGLPVTIDPSTGQPDNADQLQRVSMLAVGELVTGCPPLLQHPALSYLPLFTPDYGWLYERAPGRPTADVSADQLISCLCALVLAGEMGRAAKLTLRCLGSAGFAQNYKDGLGADEADKLPDFMLARALPLMVRMNAFFYPLALLADALLVALAVSSVIYSRANPGNVDLNVTVMTLTVCSKHMATPLSWLARKILTWFTPVNDGTAPGIGNVQAALTWYHRAAAGGNPQLADLYKPITQELFT